MSILTSIQWCDSTINPIMGCLGCELYPQPETILSRIDKAIQDLGTSTWQDGHAALVFQRALDDSWTELCQQIGSPHAGHTRALTSTNLRHLRHRIRALISDEYGADAGNAALATIERSLKCYAAQLHGNRGFNIEKPNRNVNSGYAPTFEHVTRFPGRLDEMARRSDLTGSTRPDKPWLDRLPRTIFVSDMGDAFSRHEDFPYLEEEISAFSTESGRRHLWLWLTKRPEAMREFTDEIGGFGSNVCAMTTVTSSRQLRRVDALRNVKAHVKGLSIEPLWDSVSSIDLTGIDWVIAGGESGARANVQPFNLEWAYELLDLCRVNNVAFFLKQLGSRPVLDGAELRLNHHHGGDWDEWPADLRVREFPSYFHEYANLSTAECRISE